MVSLILSQQILKGWRLELMYMTLSFAVLMATLIQLFRHMSSS